MSFAELFGAPTTAARDRITLLCSIGALGREVPDDAIFDAMARAIPSWTWEAVGHCCADLADGGALERLRGDRDVVVGWRITDAAARWMLTATSCALAATPNERTRIPAWMLALAPSLPKPTTTSMTITKAVEP